MKPSPQKHHREVWDRFWRRNRQIDQVYSNAERVAGQLRRLGPLMGKKVVEVGAGSGRDSLALAAEGAIVTMLDYSQDALQLMREQIRQSHIKVQLICGDAFHLPFKDGSVDVIFHQGLLEHFTNPEGILKENHRVLKPGGFALADVPQKYHLYTVVKHLLIRLNKWFAGWETEFSLHQLQSLFRQAGFTIYASYGDWMRPSFLYRALRQMLKPFSLHLPLYPKSLLGLANLRAKMRQRLYRKAWSFYTYMDIGVIGKKA